MVVCRSYSLALGWIYRERQMNSITEEIRHDAPSAPRCQRPPRPCRQGRTRFSQPQPQPALHQSMVGASPAGWRDLPGHRPEPALFRQPRLDRVGLHARGASTTLDEGCPGRKRQAGGRTAGRRCAGHRHAALQLRHAGGAQGLDRSGGAPEPHGRAGREQPARSLRAHVGGSGAARGHPHRPGRRGLRPRRGDGAYEPSGAEPGDRAGVHRHHPHPPDRHRGPGGGGRAAGQFGGRGAASGGCAGDGAAEHHRRATPRISQRQAEAS